MTVQHLTFNDVKIMWNTILSKYSNEPETLRLETSRLISLFSLSPKIQSRCYNRVKNEWVFTYSYELIDLNKIQKENPS
jgi:hypothetical protein